MVNFISVIPDYYITGTINNIEIYQNGKNIFAHLNVVMEFRDKERNILVSHKIDKKEDIAKYDVSYFMKIVSDILKSETHEFLIKIVDYFSKSK